MKLVTYDRNDSPRAGLFIEDMIVDLQKGARALLGEKLPATIKELLNAGPQALEAARQMGDKAKALIEEIQNGTARKPVWLFPEEEIHLGPPLPDPEKIICLGLNYKDHVKEQEGRFHKTVEPPENPIIFAKFASALSGPNDPILLPPAKVTGQVDYEVELALVIGRTVQGISPKEALSAVAGYMIMNDVSARDCQFSDKQWVRSKSFDSFAPCGPWLATPEEVGDPHKLRIWTVLNGETVQESSTRHLIFKIPRIIAYLSQAITLKAGDIISTGTPAGVGIFQDPPRLLKAGDTVECGIEGLGTLCNLCEQR